VGSPASPGHSRGLAEYQDTTLAQYADARLPAWKHETESKTFRNYEQLLRLHVLTTLGRLKLRDLRRRHIKALLSEKRAQGKAKDTVRLIRAALSSLLTDAVDDEIIAANPALQIGRKKRKRVDTITQGERQQRIRPMSWISAKRFSRPVGPAPALCCSVCSRRPGSGQERRTPYSRRTLTWMESRPCAQSAWTGMTLKPTKTEETRSVD
jgi:hypothetical protein